MALNDRARESEHSIEDYTILEPIGPSATSTTYLATSKRGRLRNRLVALKKISLHKSTANSSALHYALHHPNIISLLAFFPTSLCHIHILELCSNGTLDAYVHSRTPPTLGERELRGVARCMVDALTYLRKELVIVRNLTPKNILLSDEYRPKIADFRSAIRLPTVNTTINTPCDTSNYISPEMFSSVPYSFLIDIWSLGCLILECITGKTPFESPNTSTDFENYSLPKAISYEAAGLIGSLLQIESAHRIPLHRILCHPFFDPALPCLSLHATSTGKENKQPSTPSILKPMYSKPPLSFLPPLKQDKARIINLDLRNILQDDPISGDRRVVSDPLPRSSVAAELKALSIGQARTRRSSLAWTRPNTNAVVSGFSAQSVLAQPEEVLTETETVSSTAGFAKPRRYPFLKEPINFKVTGSSTRKSSGNTLREPLMDTPRSSLDKPALFAPRPDSPSSCIAIGTERPKATSTLLLNPQTHRTVNGTLTILPSRSLLVDLREGERRRGKKGDQVLLVDSQGSIQVYSAPHLSTPCCLTEPLATYSLDKLPVSYWKTYNDASHLIEQIKQRTPELVMYTENAKCILMANAPQADIELIFRGQDVPSSSTKKNTKPKRSDEMNSATMRIRFSRQTFALEIARHIEGVQGGEWTKKVLHVLPGSWRLSDVDWDNLQDVEKDGICRLNGFITTCESIEKTSDDESNGRINLKPPLSTLEGLKRFSSLIRPPLPPLSKYALGDDHTPFSSNVAAANFYRHDSTAADFPRRTSDNFEQFQESQTEMDLTIEGHGIQSRYIPSVGWCIRYPSRVSQGGRYRIMFLDGVALDIDVDEEWVEMKNGSGNVTRCDIRHCHSTRKVGDRMRVFDEFVSMFDSNVSRNDCV